MSDATVEHAEPVETTESVQTTESVDAGDIAELTDPVDVADPAAATAAGSAEPGAPGEPAEQADHDDLRAVMTGDIVIDAALQDLAAVEATDLDGHIEAAEALQRTLQGRLANRGE